MPRVVVHGTRSIPSVDPARVWSLVADPARLEEWTGLRLVGYMGNDMPNVGNAFFVTRRGGEKPDRATRFEVVEWEAGRRVRCAVRGPGSGEDSEMEVRVDAVPAAGAPRSELTLVYRTTVGRWLAPTYRWWIDRRLRKVLDGAERALG